MIKDRFHVNNAGEATKCNAFICCPFGDLESDHYNDKASARRSYEERMGTGFESADSIRTELEELQERQAALSINIAEFSDSLFDGSSGWEALNQMNLKLKLMQADFDVLTLHIKTLRNNLDLANEREADKKLSPAAFLAKFGEEAFNEEYAKRAAAPQPVVEYVEFTSRGCGYSSSRC